MAEDTKPEPTQKTQPAKGKPVDIPVPEREDIERLLTKAAQPSDAATSADK